MNALIIVNLEKSHAQKCAAQISQLLTDIGYSAKTIPYNYSADFKQLHELVSFVIAVGGDGTIIHTAKAAAAYDLPILGVNVGALGFTAGIELDELHHLSRLKDQEYIVEDRYLLEVTLTASVGQSKRYALNDAIISGSASKIIQYCLSIDTHQPYIYRADGFIVSTATGSTAYSLSAGGPVIEPSMDCMVYTPICPHSLFNRSIIFKRGTDLHAEAPHNDSSIHLTIDGERPTTLNAGDRISFTISDRTVKFIRLTERSFYDTLNKKMMQTDRY